ncbi:MAG TPA: lamin tail domain-containing protein, partial [Kofleriaceae bacterium]|nr:lamin tail domain-containing protein [Kofleriaceae bacterium]
CAATQSCVLGQCVTGVGDLVLSEVHAEHPSYFEIYNGGSAAIDLTDYLIQWNTDNAGSGSVALPAYTLQPDSFLVLQEGTGVDRAGVIYLGDSISWSSGVAVRLLEPLGAGIDFVRTGISTFAPPPGTTWTGANAANPSATTSQSLVRNVFVPDTDSADDWTLTAQGSPGSYCALPGRCGDTCYDFASDHDNCGECGMTCGGSQLCLDGQCRSGVSKPWISEYRLSPRAAVEIHNPTAAPINMNGYRLDISGANSLSHTFGAFTLQPGAFVSVYMGNGTDDATSLYAGPSRAFAEDVGIALYDDGTTALDFVRFGNSSEPAPVSAPWFGNNVPAVSRTGDVSTRRDLEKLDTDSAADWSAGSPSTLGFACYGGLSMCSGTCRALAVDPDACGSCTNSCDAHETCRASTCRSIGKVVIAELTNASPEAIELFNGTDAAVDIGGWTLDWVADNVASFTIPGGTTLPAGGSIGFIEGTGTNTATRIYMGAPAITWNEFIAVSLSDASTTELDFVRTGTSVTSGTWTGSNAPNPTNSQSLVRDVYTADTNGAADWSIATTATQGARCPAGESVCSGACANLQDDPAHCGACGNTCGPGVSCHQGSCVAEGAIRLTPITVSEPGYGGRLDVFHNRQWRVIYSYNNQTFTDVACRQHGFSTGILTTTTRTSGCSGCGYFQSFNCTGAEARVADCAFDSYDGTGVSGYRVTCTP